MRWTFFSAVVAADDMGFFSLVMLQSLLIGKIARKRPIAPQRVWM
jgi:hypothetical protein